MRLTSADETDFTGRQLSEKAALDQKQLLVSPHCKPFMLPIPWTLGRVAFAYNGSSLLWQLLSPDHEVLLGQRSSMK